MESSSFMQVIEGIFQEIVDACVPEVYRAYDLDMMTYGTCDLNQVVYESLRSYLNDK